MLKLNAEQSCRSMPRMNVLSQECRDLFLVVTLLVLFQISLYNGTDIKYTIKPKYATFAHRRDGVS